MFIMGARRPAISIAAIATLVAVVPSVSGFAQSNSGYSAVFAIDRTPLPIVREYVPRDEPIPLSIPPNLTLPSIYEPVVRTMLQRSPTFRRQCRRIAHTPRLTITVQHVGLSAIGRVRARTRIVRSNAVIDAAIQVLHLEDPVELIAHEIEHIIEQLDGVDLASRAAISTSGVRTTDGERHTFETARARRVGLTVAAEVRAGGP